MLVISGAHDAALYQGYVMAVRDSNGNELKEGDTVVVIKDLKVKGSSSGIKRGTVVKNISPTTKTRSKAAPTRSRVSCCARNSSRRRDPARLES